MKSGIYIALILCYTLIHIIEKTSTLKNVQDKGDSDCNQNELKFFRFPEESQVDLGLDTAIIAPVFLCKVSHLMSYFYKELFALIAITNFHSSKFLL